MEIIRKKINLENFRSRIPSLLETVEDSLETRNGSWGKTPMGVGFLGAYMKYGTLMHLYYILFRVINKSIYYEYDSDKKKWLKIDMNWREVYDNKDKITYKTYLTDTYTNKGIIGITDYEGVYYFYDEIKKLTNGSNYTGFDIINKIHKIIGKIEIPPFKQCSKCNKIIVTKDDKCNNNGCNGELKELPQPIYVPFFIYYAEIEDYIELLTELQKETTTCCGKSRYEEHGGDAFMTFLEEEFEKPIEIEPGDQNSTIDIPILLTSKLLDIGQYQVHDVDVVVEGGKPEEKIPINTTHTIVKTCGESKLKTLRKRKISLDDYGNELPGILPDGNLNEILNEKSNKLTMPYEVGYLKNIQIINNIFYGDTISRIRETYDFAEQAKESYDIVVETLKEYGFTDKVITGTLTNAIEGLTLSINQSREYGRRKKLTYEEVIAQANSDVTNFRNNIKEKLLKLLTDKKFPEALCMSQEIKMTSEIYYYKTPDSPQTSETIVTEETICLIFSNPKIEVTYVTGGRLMTDKDNKLTLYEASPFTSGDDWDGEGIWYKEIFPLKKMCMDMFTINGKEYPFFFDMIDFKSKEITYAFEGIDFPRKNYILCEDIRYKSETYKENATNDFVFKNEGMTGINYPLKEQYDVLIDRGVAVAFEKHLQLGEIKTWEDLENYRNGVFLNK